MGLTFRAFNRTEIDLSFFLDDIDADLPAGRWVDVPAEIVYRFLLRDAGKDILVDFGPDMIPLDGQKPWPHLLFATQINCVTGYGSAGIHLAKELNRLCDLSLYKISPLQWNSRYAGRTIQRLMQKEPEDCEWGLGLVIPPELPRIPTPRRILYTMWELSEIPRGHLGEDPTIANWGKIVNDWAEAIIVPCEDQRQSWERGGVKIPIHIVPLGVDFATYRYRERPPRPDKPFTILVFGWLSSRKSPIETLIEVCWHGLRDRPDWKLILKSYGGVFGGGSFTPLIYDERVEMIDAHYTPKQMADLCYQADVGICLSKYEGFGLPFRQMMAAGLPVIVSANSGHLEDCDPRYNIPIPTDSWMMVEPSMGEGGAKWAVPDWGLAAYELRTLYEKWRDRGSRQMEIGTRAAKWIRRRRSWRTTAKAVIEIIGQYAARGEGANG